VPWERKPKQGSWLSKARKVRLIGKEGKKSAFARRGNASDFAHQNK
jgi:hypothetical protein